MTKWIYQYVHRRYGKSLKTSANNPCTIVLVQFPDVMCAMWMCTYVIEFHMQKHQPNRDEVVLLAGRCAVAMDESPHKKKPPMCTQNSTTLTSSIGLCNAAEKSMS